MLILSTLATLFLPLEYGLYTSRISSLSSSLPMCILQRLCHLKEWEDCRFCISVRRTLAEVKKQQFRQWCKKHSKTSYTSLEEKQQGQTRSFPPCLHRTCSRWYCSWVLSEQYQVSPIYRQFRHCTSQIFPRTRTRHQNLFLLPIHLRFEELCQLSLFLLRSYSLRPTLDNKHRGTSSIGLGPNKIRNRNSWYALKHHRCTCLFRLSIWAHRIEHGMLFDQSPRRCLVTGVINQVSFGSRTSKSLMHRSLSARPLSNQL